MRLSSESGSNIPCAATITSARPKNDQASADNTKPIIKKTTACRTREGSAVRMAMPSELWSSSASLKGLRLIPCVIASSSQQPKLGLQQFGVEDIAQLQQGAALLVHFGPDLFVNLGRGVGAGRIHLRVHLHAALRPS